ncbi:MAG TPA: EAL domain-containing protein [Noviherbaspirillum sp.]|nr:EAL domain-containing protein [Noviherbaspirillum sp.]
MQEAFHLTAEQYALGIFWLDSNGIITHANEAAGCLTGADVDAMTGKPVWDYIAEWNPSAWQELAACIAPEKAKQLRVTIRMTDHGSAAAEAHVRHLKMQGFTSFAVFLHGIATRARTEDLFRLQHNLLEAVARGESLEKLLTQLCNDVEAMAPELHCSVMLVDEQDRAHVVAAPSLPKAYAEALEGAQIGPVEGSCGTAVYYNQPVQVSDIAHDPLWENYRDLVLPMGLAASWSSPIIARDGTALGTFAVYYHERRVPSEFHRQLVEVCTHLTAIAVERSHADERLHNLAFYDPLTKLPNRKLLADRAEIALANAVHDSSPLAVLFVDLDRFKTINDTLGHEVGDKFLKAIAEQFSHAVRHGDTVSRVGGDEFVLLLPHCDGHQAATLAQRLLEIAATPVTVDGHRLDGTACVGISLYPGDAQNYDVLLRYADMAMYQAKAGGRNTYRFFSRELNASIQEAVALERALRHALEERRLSVYYQPKLSLNDEAVAGVEALVRWHDPHMGTVSPARFIPIAEESGLINELGLWVLEEACRRLAEWRNGGLQIPSMQVNVSPKQLGRKDLPALIADILRRYALPPSSLILEITESSMIDDNERSTAALSALSAVGIKLAVDDFGTGYSSLSYLKRFPVQELKLDQSFVRHLDDNKSDRELASAVINIGRALHLTVVAEGVEHQSQLDFLRAQQCDLAQGFYYSRPLPSHEFENWLAARAS